MEPEKKTMEHRPQKRSRSGERLASERVPEFRPVEPRGANLWLESLARIHCLLALQRAVPEDRDDAPDVLHKQLLVVLERDGAGVEVHQLPVGSDGAWKPKCIKLGGKNEDTFRGS